MNSGIAGYGGAMLSNEVVSGLYQIAQRNGKTLDQSFFDELSDYAQRIAPDHTISDVNTVITGLGTISIALPVRTVGARHVRLGLDMLHGDPFKSCRKAANTILSDPTVVPRI